MSISNEQADVRQVHFRLSRKVLFASGFLSCLLVAGPAVWWFGSQQTALLQESHVEEVRRLKEASQVQTRALGRSTDCQGILWTLERQAVSLSNFRAAVAGAAVPPAADPGKAKDGRTRPPETKRKAADLFEQRVASYHGAVLAGVDELLVDSEKLRSALSNPLAAGKACALTAPHSKAPVLWMGHGKVFRADGWEDVRP